MSASPDDAPVQLAELVAALSLGIDLGFAQPMEHTLRQCLIALRMAERLDLDEPQRVAVYYTALLISVACHADAHEQAKWFGDDIALKADKHKYDSRSLRTTLSGVRRLGSGGSPLHRFRLGLEFVLSGHRSLDGMVAHHASLARRLAEQLSLPDEVLRALMASYERWDGRGWPGHLGGNAIPIAARIGQAAEYVEVANRIGGITAVKRLVRDLRGRQFDPTLCDLLTSEADAIFSDLDAVVVWDAVIGAEPALAVVLTGDRLHAALVAIANFVDLKSPYFLGHAQAVAELAAEAGQRSGLDEGDVRRLRHAGLLHGLGRLGISNAIWDKRGPLGAGEWERVRLQPYLTARMLRQSRAFGPIAGIVLQHRERLDGSGYPNGLVGTAIGREARILAAADATEAVLGAAGHRVLRRREGPAGLTVREIEVLRLVARGLSNKEVAQALFIAAKTVANHIEHIYAKIDASTRAGAGLFAMQHGLLPEHEFPARPSA